MNLKNASKLDAAKYGELVPVHLNGGYYAARKEEVEPVGDAFVNLLDILDAAIAEQEATKAAKRSAWYASQDELDAQAEFMIANTTTLADGTVIVGFIEEEN